MNSMIFLTMILETSHIPIHSSTIGNANDMISLNRNDLDPTIIERDTLNMNIIDGREDDETDHDEDNGYEANLTTEDIGDEDNDDDDDD